MSETSQPARFNFTAFLTALLILLSFFLGSLWTKVQYLESNTIQAAAPVAYLAGNPQPVDLPTAPNPPTPSPRVYEKPRITDTDHIRGNKNAKITMIEYSDLECPFCKRFHPTMLQTIKEYGDKIKWIYRHYPLPFHANAQKEAEATECAAKLGGDEAFWKYVDTILERTTSNGTGFALDKLAPLAKELGLNQTKFTSCLDSGEFTQTVKGQIDSGTAEGVAGTPGTIIIDANGQTQLVPGAIPFEQLQPMIETALKSL